MINWRNNCISKSYLFFGKTFLTISINFYCNVKKIYSVYLFPQCHMIHVLHHCKITKVLSTCISCEYRDIITYDDSVSMMWETKIYGYVHKISVEWHSDSSMEMKWTKEKKKEKKTRWYRTMTMLTMYMTGVSNNKNGKYLTSALAICWEEHSLPFHYQPTTPCRRM